MGWKRLAAWVIAVLLVIAAAIFAFSRHIESHAMAMLKERYGEHVEVSNLRLTMFPRISATCGPVIVREPERAEPLVAIDRLEARTGWISAILGRVSEVRMDGLKITVPPRGERHMKPGKSTPKHFRVGAMVAENAVLKIMPGDPNKPPLEFDIHHLVLHEAGDAMSFDASLTNAKPPGEIHSTGKFGPWNSDEPAATPVSGKYTFRNADLGVFKGIRGMLASDGDYDGVLDRIEASGHTDTPDFALTVADNPMHLETDFHATIDGTNGNVYLHPVQAKLGSTGIEASGVIERMPGAHGRLISLDATVAKGRLEDLLRLAVKSKGKPDRPPMSGEVSFNTKIVIPPGDEDIAEKLQLDGGFSIARAHFSKLSVQEKVNELSNRGRGDPEAPVDAAVASNFQGRFKLDKGVMTFSRLAFEVPGIAVKLDGTYRLRGEALDLRGTAELQAKLSQTTTGFKSVLLKAFEGLFSKKNAGAVVPIKIGGTADSPSFGLRVL